MKQVEINYIKLRQRLRLARECVSEGLNLTDFAERAGISTQSAMMYLRRHSPATHEALRDGHRKSSLHPLRVLHRLRVISRHKTGQSAAKELGVTQQAISMFIKRYCPDGVEEALQDYEEAYGTPLFGNQPQEAAAVA